MGISECVYIDRKALELIEELLECTILEDENTLKMRVGEIKGVVMFADLLKEGENDERVH